MGARALGVGALFVNVLLVLARDGSRSPPPPLQHPLRLLLLPSCVSPAKAGSADTQPPGQRPRCAFRETRAGLGASFYLFILFKGGGLAWHTLLLTFGMPPCLP